jgi:hypothetical protein
VLKPCFARDEGRPLGTALQEEVPNHRKLLGSTALVVSVAGKVEARPRQVSASELKEPKPLLTCRNSLDVTKTRSTFLYIPVVTTAQGA